MTGKQPAATGPAGGPPPKRRGAQPGNTNALKHGFYSRRFTPLELRDVPTALATGLQDEIVLLRVAMRRVMDLDAGDPNLVEAIRVMTSLGVTATRLAALLRTQQALGLDEASELYATITRAIAEVNEELRHP